MHHFLSHLRRRFSAIAFSRLLNCRYFIALIVDVAISVRRALSSLLLPRSFSSSLVLLHRVPPSLPVALINLSFFVIDFCASARRTNNSPTVSATALFRVRPCEYSHSSSRIRPTLAATGFFLPQGGVCVTLGRTISQRTTTARYATALRNCLMVFDSG